MAEAKEPTPDVEGEEWVITPESVAALHDACSRITPEERGTTILVPKPVAQRMRRKRDG